jgi:hypothetical protein
MDMSTQKNLTNIALDKATYATKIYGSKLPPKVNNLMWNFTGNSCLEVMKLQESLGLNQKRLNCHANVIEHVSVYGGEVMNGWLLMKNKKLNKSGVWVWSFHSIWKTSEGLLIDVTFDENYEACDRTIFYPDKFRKVDLEQGIAYNNIMIFSNAKFTEHYSSYIGEKLTTREIFWTNESLIRVKRLKQHTGQYRLLKAEYKENRKLFEETYGVKILENGGLDSTNFKGNMEDAIFDFGVSAR